MSRVKKPYRSKNGSHYFTFEFRSCGDRVDIYCKNPPGLRGRNSSVHKTHRYNSGLLCFHSGREPHSQSRAEQLASQWAEYYLEYIRTGIAQS